MVLQFLEEFVGLDPALLSEEALVCIVYPSAVVLGFLCFGIFTDAFVKLLSKWGK